VQEEVTSLNWSFPANPRLRLHHGCPQSRGLQRPQKQEHAEWPLPLGEEGEKQEVDDPEKNNNPKVTRQTIIRERQDK
jgi:hypothetical protein